MTSDLPEATGELTGVAAELAAGPAAGALTGVPGIPVSAGALIFDRKRRLLILKPTYKSGWTIPGGVMEADGESPWRACQREVREECGLAVSTGRLACVDFRPPRPGRPGGIRFLFDCGVLDDAALRLLRGPIRRRVRAALAGSGPFYLEGGRPVVGLR